MKKYISIVEEDIIYNVTSVDDCVETIWKEYIKHSNAMTEVLASIMIVGFTAEEVINIYATCVRMSDSDLIVHIIDDIREADNNIVNFIDNNIILGI